MIILNYHFMIFKDQFNWTMTYRAASDIVHRFPFGLLVNMQIVTNSITGCQIRPKRNSSPGWQLIATHPSSVSTSFMNFPNTSKSTFTANAVRCIAAASTNATKSSNVIINSSCRWSRFYAQISSVKDSSGCSLPGRCLSFTEEQIMTHWHHRIPTSTSTTSTRRNNWSITCALIDSNVRIYNRFFDWKIDYKVERYPTIGWCDLCDKFNNPLLTNTRSFYQGIDIDATYHKKLTKMASKLTIKLNNKLLEQV